MPDIVLVLCTPLVALAIVLLAAPVRRPRGRDFRRHRRELL
jgi:hypothetical protein